MSVSEELRREMARRGKVGAHRLHSLYDSRELTAAARARFQSEEYWEAKVDPAAALDPEDRRRRALHARKAHYADMARRSALARQRKAAAHA